MLIICHDDFMANMQPFVKHKQDNGMIVKMVGYSQVGSGASAIQTHIKNAYNTDASLAFVLLVGDSGQIPSLSANGGLSDPSFTKLVGSDNIPEVIIGRFSAETKAHVDLLVAKSVNHETQKAYEQDWFKQGVGVGSSQGAGQGDDGEGDWQHLNMIRHGEKEGSPSTGLKGLLAHGYKTVDQIYDNNGGTKAKVTTAVNAGRGIINYTGHGSTTSWGSTGFSNTDVNALKNSNQLPFVFSVACVNGQFNNTTCFAEAWVRAGSITEPTGAVLMVASTINQSWAPPMEAQDEFNLLFIGDKANSYTTFGAMFYAGELSMMEAHSSSYDMFNTWHIFGDPSLKIK
jgi:hypothetical protein